MKKLLMKSGLVVLTVLLSVATITAQSFEGIIEFTKTVGTVNTTYKYYVKGDNVRIEEVGTKGTVQGIMLVDTKANSVTALSIEQKVYMEVPNKRPMKPVAVQVAKLKNRKEMHGYQCAEWKVTNKSEDRVISYWAAKKNFDFFIPLLKTLNRKDKQAVYFLQIEDAGGVFPMRGEEKKLDGTVVSLLDVKKITEKKLEDGLFKIPEGYGKFER